MRRSVAGVVSNQIDWLWMVESSWVATVAGKAPVSSVEPLLSEVIGVTDTREERRMYLGFCSGANLKSLVRVGRGLGHGKRTICMAQAGDDSRSAGIARKVIAFGTWGSLVSYSAFFRPSSLLETSPVVEEILK
mmetsp:Transcript_14366/g.58119  ORF Transcript_14366/g.58119 Transcript_14366/m.58119 type:complete len:134 (-) Transcript_14366:2253-2654(-)